MKQASGYLNGVVHGGSSFWPKNITVPDFWQILSTSFICDALADSTDRHLNSCHNG